MPLPEAVVALFDHKDVPVKAILTELLPKIEAEFEKSEQGFISDRRKLNAESQALRKHKIAFEKIARESGIDKVEDPDEVANQLLVKFKGTTEKSTSVEQQLQLIKQQLEKQTNETIAAKKREISASVKAKASADFAKFLFSPNLHLERAIDKEGLTIAEDGETLIWKDGEEVVDYQKGLANYITRNKDGARNIQQPGAGSTGKKKVNGSSKQESTLTQAEFDAMEPIERARFAKANPGWKMAEAG